MNKKTFLSAVLVGVALIAQAADKLIPYDSEKMKAYAPNSIDNNRGPTKVINGSGLSEDGTTHGSTNNDMWMSANAKSIDALPTWFLVDLGLSKNLARLHIWNFQGQYSYRGIKSMNVYVSTADSVPKDAFDPNAQDGSGNPLWTLATAEPITLAQGKPAGEDLQFASTQKARWVALHFLAYYYGNPSTDKYGPYCGLAEMRFFEEAGVASFTDLSVSTTASSATVQGTLYLPPTWDNAPVGIVWGKTAGGTSLASWENSKLSGSSAAGAVSVTIDGLEVDETYFYALYATNKDESLSFSETGTFLVYQPTICVWTGTAGDGAWATPENWSTGYAPHDADAVRFPAEATGTVTMDGDVTVAAVDFGTSTVKLAGEGTLSTTAITLTGDETSETAITSELAVKLNPLAQSGTTNFVFEIGVNRVLVSSGDVLPVTDPNRVIRKTGAGTIQRTAQVSAVIDNSYTGGWIIEEGQIKLQGTVAGLLRGSFYVGGYGKPASLYGASVNALASQSHVYVYDRGECNIGTMEQGRAKWVSLYEGSTMTVRGNAGYNLFQLDLYGASIGTDGDGTAYINSAEANKKCIIAHDSTVQNEVNLPFVGNVWGMAIKAEPSRMPVGLLLNKPLKSGVTSTSLVLSGGGVIKSVASNPDLVYPLVVGSTTDRSSVTCYLDGATMAGGQNPVLIHHDSTLAGIGTLGNGQGAELVVNVNDDDKSTGCTIAPGTIDNVTGAHVYGTLTAGDADHTRQVQFNNNGRILCRLGENRQCDKLMVYGTVVVAGTGNTIELVVPDDWKAVKSGRYTLLEATEGIVDADGNAVDDPFTLVGASKKVKFGVEKNGSGAITKIYADVWANGLMLILR